MIYTRIVYRDCIQRLYTKIVYKDCIQRLYTKIIYTDFTTVVHQRSSSTWELPSESKLADTNVVSTEDLALSDALRIVPLLPYHILIIVSFASPLVNSISTQTELAWLGAEPV